jgi:predicted Zn-dependent protease
LDAFWQPILYYFLQNTSPANYMYQPRLFIKQILHSFLLAAYLLAGTSHLASADSYDLPELGSASGAFMTPTQEKRLGQAFMRNIRGSEKIIDEPFARDYIEKLGRTLTTPPGEEISSDFDFFIVDNPQINAFAGPAGHIGIYSGLVLTTQSESELAAVLAHEIAHVTQKHLMRAFHEASQLSLPSAAILLASIILGATVGGDAALATAVTGQAALIQNQINFTRSNEKEADRVGIKTLADANFDPHAMPVFFERMGRKNRNYASELPEFLRTHPVTTNRIADSLSRADQFPYQQHRDHLHYHLVKTLIRQKSFTRQSEAELFFRTNIEEGRHRNLASQQFGLVLTLIDQQRHKEAQKIINQLLKQYPQEAVFHIFDSRLKAQSGQLQSAISSLEKSQNDLPDNYGINMQLAELYIQAGQYDKAINLLQLITLLRPYDDQVYKRLAEAAGKNQNLAIAHAYQADYLYLNGQLEAAIKQLEIALLQDDLDFYLASSLESKLQNMQAEFKILKASKK